MSQSSAATRRACLSSSSFSVAHRYSSEVQIREEREKLSKKEGTRLNSE
jgi:hypothetical protein